MDGALAKVKNQMSQFGAFLDSFVDRYSEAAIHGGLLIYYIQQTPFTGCVGCTDTGQTRHWIGYYNHMALESYVAIGMTPGEAIVASTRDSADMAAYCNWRASRPYFARLAELARLAAEPPLPLQKRLKALVL